MKDLIIVGGGGFGREAYHIAKDIGTWNIKGFIDDNLNGQSIKGACSVIGTIKDWQPSKNEIFVMGISSPKGKEKVAGILQAKGAEFITLINTSARVNKTAFIGKGCVISGGSIGDLAQIGDFVHIAGSMVGQDAVIGDYSTTTGFANITDAHIGKRVFIGSHAVVLNKRKVGDDAFICAGSIVFHNIKPGSKVMGNPAKKVDFDF